MLDRVGMTIRAIEGASILVSVGIWIMGGCALETGSSLDTGANGQSKVHEANVALQGTTRCEWGFRYRDCLAAQDGIREWVHTVDLAVPLIPGGGNERPWSHRVELSFEQLTQLAPDTLSIYDPDSEPGNWK